MSNLRKGDVPYVNTCFNPCRMSLSHVACRISEMPMSPCRLIPMLFNSVYLLVIVGGAVFYGYKRLLFDTNIESYPQGSLVGKNMRFLSNSV